MLLLDEPTNHLDVDGILSSMGFLVRVLVNALAIFFAAALVPGIAAW